MFTGIVEELGEIAGRHPSREGLVFTIKGKVVLQDLKIGDSICVNGVCLTATKISPPLFNADVMPETLRRSTLHSLRAGDQVNLERALTPSSRLGGHFVSGHIDGVGKITEKRTEGNAILVSFTAPHELMSYIVEKGSIAVDGISLTVVEAGENFFSVSLVPHTADLTTLGFKNPGGEVNLEVDMLAKYIEKQLQAFLKKEAPASSLNNKGSETDERFNKLLKEQGYV